jgi:peptidoglycan/LPS O-acetylase OafA/YrhL
MQVSYFKELDGVRGIAALMVVTFHFFQPFIRHAEPLLRNVSKIAFIGQTGVTLFFVLSGFLITRILLRSKERPAFFSTFYFRRSLRIFPLYFIFLSIYYFIIPLLENSAVVSFNKQWPYWVYLQNFAVTFDWSSAGPKHFWSLAVEEHFYLFWPLIVYFFNRKSLKIIIWSLFPVVLITRFLLLMNGHEVFYFTFTTLDGLALGALLAVQENECRLPGAKKSVFILIGILSVLGLGWGLTSGKAIFFIQVFKLTAIAVAYYAIIALILSVKGGQNPFTQLLSSKPLSFCGKISYGIYVYHVVCIHLVSKFLPGINIVSGFAMSIACTLLIASISYFAIENQFLKLKDRFSYQ